MPARFYVYAVVVHFWWYQLDRARICTTRATFYLPDSLCSYVDFGHFCLFFDPGNFGPKRPKPHILVNVVGLMAVLARSVSWIWVGCFQTRIEHMLADGLLKCEHRAICMVFYMILPSASRTHKFVGLFPKTRFFLQL